MQPPHIPRLAPSKEHERRHMKPPGVLQRCCWRALILPGVLGIGQLAFGQPTVTGTGAAAARYSVDLSWSPSVFTVAGNIYRGTASGGPYGKVNSSLTAVNATGEESISSNQVQAVIPPL